MRVVTPTFCCYWVMLREVITRSWGIASGGWRPVGGKMKARDKVRRSTGSCFFVGLCKAKVWVSVHKQLSMSGVAVMRSVTHSAGLFTPELRFLGVRVMLTISHIRKATTL